jgi:NAD(P)-dependent dehydrogenase (short-subunit alcohol dehydrogenase family)
MINRKIVVVGGSRGIGAAVAKHLAHKKRGLAHFW